MSKIEEALEKANKLRETPEIKKEVIFQKETQPLAISSQYVITVNQPDSPVAEEYRKLKSMIIRETKSDFLNTIMITSTIENEGKTLTAINFAISVAQEIDHSIVLIDADLRKPNIHEYFGIKPKMGLSDYLTKDIDISEVMIKTGIGNLVIIPAGKVLQNPVELLASKKMKSLIDELKHRYVDRYIIVDTPPLLPFADALTLGNYVDGIVFVVKEGHAQLKSIKEALNSIENLKILGIVFNSASNGNLDGSYYSRYHRYYNQRRENQ